MRASHGIIFAKSILGRENSQCKSPEADGDWLVLRNSKRAGVAKSRVSKKSCSMQGLFGHQGVWLLSSMKHRGFSAGEGKM